MKISTFNTVKRAFIACSMLSTMALAGQAAVTEASDLYGTYKFTATEDPSTQADYKGVFPSEFTVTIGESYNPIYVALTGVAGSQSVLNAAYDLTAKTLTVTGYDLPAFKDGDYSVVFSNFQGVYPYNPDALASLVFTFDDDKNITLADGYSIGLVNHADKSFDAYAKFSNVKGVYQNGGGETPVETADFTGTYTVKATVYDYSAGATPTSSQEEFKMTLTPGDAANTYTLTDILGTTELSSPEISASGNTLTMSGLLFARVGAAEAGVGYQHLASGGSAWGGFVEDGTITLDVNAQGEYTLSDFCLFQRKFNPASDTILKYYTQITCTKDGQSSIEDVATDKVVPAYAANGVIYINGEAEVNVYTISGQKVFSGVTSSIDNLPAGFYIVTVGDDAVKIRL